MISMIIYIFRGICQVVLGLISLDLYKKKKNIAFLLASFAFFLQIYEILLLDTILPNFITYSVSLLQGVLFISSIVLFIRSYKKGELLK